MDRPEQHEPDLGNEGVDPLAKQMAARVSRRLALEPEIERLDELERKLTQLNRAATFGGIAAALLLSGGIAFAFLFTWEDGFVALASLLSLVVVLYVAAQAGRRAGKAARVQRIVIETLLDHTSGE